MCLRPMRSAWVGMFHFIGSFFVARYFFVARFLAIQGGAMNMKKANPRVGFLGAGKEGSGAPGLQRGSGGEQHIGG